jgi:hypothetical protein
VNLVVGEPARDAKQARRLLGAERHSSSGGRSHVTTPPASASTAGNVRRHWAARRGDSVSTAWRAVRPAVETCRPRPSVPISAPRVTANQCRPLGEATTSSRSARNAGQVAALSPVWGAGAPRTRSVLHGQRQGKYDGPPELLPSPGTECEEHTRGSPTNPQTTEGDPGGTPKTIRGSADRAAHGLHRLRQSTSLAVRSRTTARAS